MLSCSDMSSLALKSQESTKAKKFELKTVWLIMLCNVTIQIQRSPCLNAFIMSSIEKSFSSELCGKIIFFIAGIFCSLLADDLKTSPLFGSIIMFPIWCTKLSGKRREGLKSLDNWFGCTCKIHSVQDQVILNLYTVFPHIVSAETILFLIW